MKKETVPVKSSTGEDIQSLWNGVVRRRSFLKDIGLASAALPAGALLAKGDDRKRLPRGDVAILRFLAAAEIIESDLWQQYNELGGVAGGNPAYILALENLDERHAPVHCR